MSEWIGDVNNDSYEGEWGEKREFAKSIRVEDLVTFTKEEYEVIRKKLEFLECLEACGVDNWQGYDDAWEMMNEED